MDYKIVFSETAIEDLEGIVRFIGDDNPLAARRFGEKLMDSVRHLAVFPRMGRVVPEQRDENIREIVLNPYRIFYRVGDDTGLIEVIRFWHSARGEPQISPGSLGF